MGMTIKQFQMSRELTNNELVEFYAQVIVEVIEDYENDDSVAIDYVLMQDALISIMLDIRASISFNRFSYSDDSFDKICNMLGKLATMIHTISINLYHHNIEDIKVAESFNKFLSKNTIYIMKGGE